MKSTAIARKVAATALSLSSVWFMSACSQSGSSSLALPTSADTGIIGGTEMTGTEPYAPHVVGVYDGMRGAICTGSILSSSIIVTAAHCVESGASALRLVFGNDFNSSTIIVRGVDALKVSPLWPYRKNEELNTGDIALIKFSGGLPPGYKAIKFLTDPAKLATGMSTTLAGFGAADVVTVRDPRTGRSEYDHTGSGKLRYAATTIKKSDFTVSEFVTDASQGRGACHGDSGGPAFATIDGEMVVTGVTSRSYDDPTDSCGVGAVYTSIPFFAKWIVDSSKQLNNLVIASRPARSSSVAHR